MSLEKFIGIISLRSPRCAGIFGHCEPLSGALAGRALSALDTIARSGNLGDSGEPGFAIRDEPPGKAVIICRHLRRNTPFTPFRIDPYNED